MRLNKKVIGAVLGITGILAITAVTTNDALVSETVQGVSEAANTSLEDEAIAGVTATIYEYQRNAAKQTAKNVSVEKKDIEVLHPHIQEFATHLQIEFLCQGALCIRYLGQTSMGGLLAYTLHGRHNTR